MEEKSTNNVAAATNQNQSTNGDKKKKQRFSLFNAAMVMLRNQRNEKPKPVKIIKVTNNHTNNSSDDKWKKLVGSIRPLHLQDNQSPPPRNPAIARAVVIPTGERSEVDELFPSSPSSSWGTTSQYASTNNLQELVGTGSMSQSSSASNLQELAGMGTMSQSASVNNLKKMSGSMSQYASAINLLELDGEDEDEEDEEESDKVLENYAADVMIDTKADEFIAQFYEQMRCQHKGKRWEH